MSGPMLEIDGLVKTFDSIKAVDGVSFSVKKGEVLGFLGPNGAGKSTTMKMITGFLRPNAGRVNVCGHDLANEPIAAQSQIGYLPEGAPAYGDMTPARFLEFIAEVRGYARKEADTAISQAISRAQLQSVLRQPIETLSKGFKRRVGLAQAILHDPPILIMDEPTDGLDPNQKFAVRRLISAMAKDKAIIISTHILEEVDAVCSRALIIDRGKIVADGTPQDLMSKSTYFNAVTVSVGMSDSQTAKPQLQSIKGVDHLLEDTSSAGIARYTLIPQPGVLLFEPVSALLATVDWDIRGVVVEAGRLDDVFRNCTTSDASPQEAQT